MNRLSRSVARSVPKVPPVHQPRLFKPPSRGSTYRTAVTKLPSKIQEANWLHADVLMGITGLWDQLGDGEVVGIAKFAGDFYEQNSRPLRIAVDAAGWRFSNLTDHQVRTIQEIFDGPRRPHKRGRPAGFIPYEKTDLLKKTLRHFKVPYHQAPAEAEAECAALQREGIVDAAWSEDGDALMFGCGMLITNYCEAVKGGRKRLTDKVSIYRPRDILQQHDFNQQSYVLFAMLSGGDYNDKGLPNCGPKTAYKICKTRHGLGDSLSRADQCTIVGWTSELRDALEGVGKYVDVPPTFPEYRTLVKYRDPVISSQYELKQRPAWELPIQEHTLRPFLRDTFNVWTRGYVKHICPILLVQNLVKTRQDKSVNDAYEIRPRHKRKTKKSRNEPEDPACKLITFNPLAASSLDLVTPPSEKDWSEFETKGEPEGFDPTARVECELPIAILKQAIRDEVLNAPPPTSSPRKRKRATDQSEGGDVEVAAKPKGKRKMQAAALRGEDEAEKPKRKRKQNNTGANPSASKETISKPRRSRKKRAAVAEPELASVDQPTESTRSPYEATPTKLAVFRRPDELPSYIFGSSLEPSSAPPPRTLLTAPTGPSSADRAPAKPSPSSPQPSNRLPGPPTTPLVASTLIPPQPPSPAMVRRLRLQALDARTPRLPDPSPGVGLAASNTASVQPSGVISSTSKPTAGVPRIGFFDLDSDDEALPPAVTKPVKAAAVIASAITTGALPAIVDTLAPRSKTKAPVEVVDLT